ncbi:GbsR/MarR family transcriptional regulator [Synoicihabitans lomoniglobus]|uniref:HTH-type transcriptional regulator n=1 Tax=Synoicihabitans lomoniglobus TaxID=2909285 RepID=A0AAE9ZXQ5_9BACT|nr:MarR family transcriptional regulator [Opitutaceae bacterium LMO-M01]WED64493.1 MarR family transcriptional regulator [Opitutaceae bacterium LMO-M01]
MRKFILHWGEMGTKWGINRSVAQIHALLYVAGEPLTADELVEHLEIARSNVSMSLKELNGWGLIRNVHKTGDRRDHFETHTDVWEMFRIIMIERQRREIEPTVRLLDECVAESEANEATANPQRHERLVAMQEFMQLSASWGHRTSGLSAKKMKKLAQLGDTIFRLID